MKGMENLKIEAGMELRFALHNPANKSLIDLLTAVQNAEIHTFGWPIGITLDNSDLHRPKPFSDGIRAEISIESDETFGRRSYDYWAFAKSGDFYLNQSLFEDMRDDKKIFFNTRIVRVTESLMFAGNLYANLGVHPDTKLSFRINHYGIAQRTLASAGGRRHVSPNDCSENSCESEIVITLGTIRETLVSDVKRLTSPLFMLFGFMEFQDSVYEDIVRKFEAGEST